MSAAAQRTLLALLIPLSSLHLCAKALPPPPPSNVQVVPLHKGLKVTWEPPHQHHYPPVTRYGISYGISMRAQSLLRAEKHEHSKVLKDLEPGVLYMLKITAENDDGVSKPVYRAEKPRGEQTRKPASLAAVRTNPSSRGAAQDHSYVLGLTRHDRDRQQEHTGGPTSLRRHHTRELASESVYVVSLQAQNAPRPSSPIKSSIANKGKPSGLPELDEARDITVRVISPQSVMVTWVDVEVEKKKVDPSLRHYTVKYREKGESARWDYKETPTRRILIEGLAADNMYEFSIKVSHGEQQGRWSSSVFQRTPESAPTGPPENFEIKPLKGKGSAAVASWDPPEEPNGRIREYIMSYAPALKPFGAKSITFSGSTTSATVDGLQPGERYIFKIRAVNRKGQGPQTKALSVAMPDSTSASASHRNSASASKTSAEDSVPPEKQASKHTSSPNRRSRPLSQTRSYHSVFSSVRSPVRSSASVSAQGKESKAEKFAHKETPKNSQTTHNNKEDLDNEDHNNKEPEMINNVETSSKHMENNTFSKVPKRAPDRTDSENVKEDPKPPNQETSEDLLPSGVSHEQTIAGPPRRKPNRARGTRRNGSSSSPAQSTLPRPQNSEDQDFKAPQNKGEVEEHPSNSPKMEQTQKLEQSSQQHHNSRSTSRDRLASTLGAQRPVLKEIPLDTDIVAQESTNPSAALIPTKPTVSKGNSDNGSQVTQKLASKNDYTYDDQKKTFDPKNHLSVTFAPTAVTPAVTSKAEDLVTPKKTESSSIQRRPAIGPNGRPRAPLLTNRQYGPRYPGRLPQQTKSGSPYPASSRLPHSFGRIAASQGGFSRVSSHRQTARNITHPEASIASPSQSSSTSPAPAQEDVKSIEVPTNTKHSYRQGKNGRPNHTVSNGKVTPVWDDGSKPASRRFITGPEGVKWIVDLEKGILMNEDGRILQDSQGRPRRVVLGEDGRTIFDDKGSPLVNPEGLALFGHGRDSRPVSNPKDKVFTLGGKPIVGLNRSRLKTTTTTTTTATTTTSTTRTTTTPPTTTEEPTTLAHPTCPPGTYSKSDERGVPLLSEDGILDCYPEDNFETTPLATTEVPTSQPEIQLVNSGPSTELDAAGEKRFTAPYVNYIRKDPGAPCSLTEALEYLQVDVLETLLEKDNPGTSRPPRNKPHNITVVAMEGCHSFVILDWARPLKDDMVSGYMVHSASYDDVLNNRWSSSTASGTHLAMENLKPNSRYYFKVQAKNVFGLGPISDTFTYVTESDDPLLIERPPGGEPIWIPFTFKYNPAQSTCRGSQFVKRTWYRKFVGVVLCNSLRYKIFMSDGLRDTFYSIGDTFGHGEDHCQFVDSYLEGRTGPHNLSEFLPTAKGFFRSDRQEPVRFGPIGRRTPNPYVGWYECGIPIPGKW